MANVWQSESSPAQQFVMAAGCTVVGVLLAYGFRHYPAYRSDAFAGFLCGWLLLVIGIAALLATGRQTVTIDPNTRLIRVEDVSRFQSKTRVIRFDEVSSVAVGFLGKNRNLVKFYYLELKLRSGRSYSLFAPGRFFPGASDRATVAGWKDRLEEYLGSGSEAAEGENMPLYTSNRSAEHR